MVTSDYFRVMGISILSGRGFTDADTSGAPIALVTADTSWRYWPDQSAVGKHIRLVDQKDWRTIVGVISDVCAYDLQRNIPEWIEGTAYVPYNPAATLEDRRMPSETTIAIRTPSDHSQIATLLRESVATLNHEVPVSEVRTMGAVVSEAVICTGVTTSLFIAFAAVALIRGIIGVYGISPFWSHNARARLACASRWERSAATCCTGIMKKAKFTTGAAVGLIGALLVMCLMSSELYGVSPLDAITFVSVAVVMAVVTLLVCYIPTRRAMRVDLIVALAGRVSLCADS